MTANSTPRLKLMSPVDTDPFEPEDFADTFNKLDSTPGFTLVSNYTSLPTNWTTAQHGSVVQQRDSGAQWMWSRPTSAVGTWKRVNSLGRIAISNGTPSTSTSSTSPVSVVTANVLAPGGRDLGVYFYFGSIAASGSVQVGIGFNGSVARSWILYNPAASPATNWAFVPLTFLTPTANTTYTFNGYIWTSGGGATISMFSPSISVVEM